VSVDGARGAEVTVAGRVEWMDTDAAGIHHNSAITRFAEAAEAELARGLGLDGYFAVAPRVRYEVTYEAPLFFGQPVSTVLYVERVGMSSLTFVFEVWGEEFNGRARTRAAKGRYVTVHVPGGVGAESGGKDGEGHGRSVPWPTAWADALAAGR
jgi:acyl-CoA thioester hydrolase